MPPASVRSGVVATATRPCDWYVVEQRRGRVLRLLDVRLVERVDPEQRAGDRRRDFPSNELGAERGRFVPVDRRRRMSVGFEPRCRGFARRCRDGPRRTDGRGRTADGVRRRFARDRHDADAVLAGAFGHELFDPEAEGLKLRREEQRQLVAAFPRGCAEQEAERDRRIVRSRRLGLRGRRASPVPSPMIAAMSCPISAAGTRPKNDSAE